jgi:hypothetical protein
MLGAQQVLKQKRLYENQREQLYNQQFNMEQTSFALESIKDTASTVQAMKAAGAEMRQAYKKQDLNIDGIEQLQDEMADLMVCLFWRCLAYPCLATLHAACPARMQQHACRPAQQHLTHATPACCMQGDILFFCTPRLLMQAGQ